MSVKLTLLLDLDDTLVCYRPEAEPPTPFLQHEMLRVIIDYAATRCDIPHEESMAKIRLIHDKTPWWDWNDFLESMDIDPQDAWPLIDAAAAHWLMPQCPGQVESLHAVANAGHHILITSNNPTSGIAHKLRIAGFDDDWQRYYIAESLGTDKIRDVKANATYWQRVLEHVDEPMDHIVVIGDNVHEDFEVPCQAGLKRFILIKNSADMKIKPDGCPEDVSVIEVENWPSLSEAVAKHAASCSE